MSLADVIGREAEAFLALSDSDYGVEIDHAVAYDWFYLTITYRGKIIYRKACLRSIPFARVRVVRVVRQHRKLVESLERERVRYGAGT